MKVELEASKETIYHMKKTMKAKDNEISQRVKQTE